MTRAGLNLISGMMPIVLSLLASALVFVAVALGAHRQPDEGAAAHTWQLLIAAQLPFLVAFLVTADWHRWQRQVGTIGLQGGALVLAIAPVAYFNL